ncbi:hypothetical protein PG997_006876 [Apiospora hydei]|uniref:Uncharacterized protein n=1 Tax=Apiospora hydei TaxID=1337664 RepID=A0ABR1WPY3_9PEZI
MDHFNSTVFNGTVVSTRRGFTVTKQKHKGLSFVNASIQDAETRTKPQTTTKTGNVLPPAATITFVTNQGEGKKGTAGQLKTTAANKGVRSSPKSDISKRRPKTRTRGRSCSSSTSASTHGSVASDLALSDTPDGRETGKGSNPLSKPLPPWASYKRPLSPPDFVRRLTFMAYALTPCKAYALDEFRLSGDGSLSVPEEIWLEKDPTSIHCATTLGVLYDTLASGKREAERLSSLSSQLVSVINRKLNAAEQTKTANNVTIHGVSALAIIAGYQGKYDHWQVHMKGLMRLLGIVGDQDRLDVRTINTIRKYVHTLPDPEADFTGAISSATKPCIPFARLHHELLVPPMVYDTAMIRAIQQHLQACALDPATVKTISDLALFNRYMEYLTMPGSSSKHDTQIVIEEYYFLKHQLLCKPRPLRESEEAISVDFSSSMPLDPNTDPYTNSIEAAVRILSLLLIRDPTLDLPCETVLTDILHQHTRTILECRRQQHQIVNTMVDPKMLLQEPWPVHPQTPTLVWICITGHYFSSLKAGATATSSSKQACFIYRELWIDLLGPGKAAHPELVSDGELELCRCLSMRHLRGETYSERGDVGNLARATKAEQYLPD